MQVKKFGQIPVQEDFFLRPFDMSGVKAEICLSLFEYKIGFGGADKFSYRFSGRCGDEAWRRFAGQIFSENP